MKRNGKVFKKTLGIVLSAAMLVSGMTFMPGSAVEVQAAATTKDVNLGFGGISDPTSTESSATAWTGSKVYYGDKLWRVLDDSGFLFSEDLLETKAYHDTTSGITWENCTLRSHLNGQTFLNSNFTGTEQDAIKDTSVTNDSNLDYSTAGGNNTTDKLFLLSLAEVRNTDYGFGSHATRAASSGWWLRSPGRSDNRAADVDYNGHVYSGGLSVGNVYGSVRPALNLNLSSVLFTSASGASKSSFGVVGDSNVSNNTWKLTLEGTENTLGANKTNGKTSLTAGYSAENLIISHSAATTLTDATQVSAMLTDSYGTVLYYGSVNSDTTATSSTVTIPAGLAVGTYSLYVIAEDVNTGNLTDYATALGTAISINVNAAPSTYAVTVNNGTGDGNYEENATVTITADAAPSGQHFKEWTGADSLNFTSGSKTSTTATFTMPAKAVAVTATYKDAPVTTYAVTVTGGTTTTPTAAEGATVSITANEPAPGKVFDKWTTTDGVVFTDESSATTTFVMPAKAVTVTATYKDAPVTTYAVTVNSGTGGGNFAEGATVSITANAPATGKVFDKWTTTDGVTFGDENTATTTFVMPAKAVTVTATYKDAPSGTYSVTISGGGSGATGAGSYAEGVTVSIYAGNRSGYTFTGWTSSDVTITNASNKNASFTMPAKNVTVKANWSYNSGGGGGGGSSSSTNATLSDTKAEFDKNEGDDLKVTLRSGSYALRSIKNGSYTLREGRDYTISGRIVTIKASYLDSLKEGKHSLAFDMSGGTDPVLTIIVTETTETDPQEEKLPVEETVNFEDVKSSDWFYGSVEYAFKNGLMVGTSDTTFSPYMNTTRGMIVTILHKLEGRPKSDAANAFTDVGADKYYTDAVAWARDNIIVSGYGNGMFGPEDSITREQMAVILMNYAKYKGYDISMKADLSKFADEESISPWAKDAISWANAEGLIQGSGSQLMPVDNALRCQVAAILQRFIETIAK